MIAILLLIIIVIEILILVIIIYSVIVVIGVMIIDKWLKISEAMFAVLYCFLSVIVWTITILGVSEFAECVQACCSDKKCNAVFYTKENCLTIQCYSDELCSPGRKSAKLAKAILINLRTVGMFCIGLVHIWCNAECWKRNNCLVLIAPG